MTIETGASRLLDPGERLIWSGRPNAFRYAINQATVPFLFGLVFFGFAVFWIQGAGRYEGLLFMLAGIPFLVIGLGFVLCPVWHYIRGTRTSYVLTNRRAVVDIAGMFARRLSVPLRQIRFVETKPRSNSLGDILFRDVIGTEGGSIRHDGFIAIADFDRVETLLRAAIDGLEQAS
jgi:hypothetical protein